jgi:hypothetical protein
MSTLTTLIACRFGRGNFELTYQITQHNPFHWDHIRYCWLKKGIYHLHFNCRVIAFDNPASEPFETRYKNLLHATSNNNPVVISFPLYLLPPSAFPISTLRRLLLNLDRYSDCSSSIFSHGCYHSDHQHHEVNYWQWRRRGHSQRSRLSLRTWTISISAQMQGIRSRCRGNCHWDCAEVSPPQIVHLLVSSATCTWQLIVCYFKAKWSYVCSSSRKRIRHQIAHQWCCYIYCKWIWSKAHSSQPCHHKITYRYFMGKHCQSLLARAIPYVYIFSFRFNTNKTYQWDDNVWMFQLLQSSKWD